MARARQPQFPARIDWRNPLTRGLLRLWNFAQEPIALARSPAAIGQGVSISTSAGATLDSGSIRSAITNQLTWFGLFDFTATQSQFLLGDVEAGGAGYNSGLYVAGGGYLTYFVKIGGAGYAAGGSTTLAGAGIVSCVGIWDGSYVRVRLNGAPDGGSGDVVAAGAIDSGAFGFQLNRWNAGFGQTGRAFVGGVANRVWSDADCLSFHRNPWQLFAPRRRVVVFGATAGGGAVTGTASITPSPQTLTGAAAVAVSGAATVTPAAQTATTAAAVAIAGTFNKTPSAQTVTASGTVATGVTGTATITPAAQTVTGSGAVPIAATATITPSAQTATTSGAVQVAATATITPAAQTLTANGSVVSGVVGNATITPAAQTSTASGAVPIAATATVTPALQTLSATAAVSGGAVTGTANVFVSAQTLVASANIIVLGTATITPAPQTLLGLEAGTLPAEVPGSSRTLAAESIRLGVSPVAADPQRLGASTVNKASPRLG
jgi:hypothetical protein